MNSGHNTCRSLLDAVIEDKNRVSNERDALLKAVLLYMKLDSNHHAGIDPRENDWGECWDAANAAMGMVDTNIQKSLGGLSNGSAKV